MGIAERGLKTCGSGVKISGFFVSSTTLDLTTGDALLEDALAIAARSAGCPARDLNSSGSQTAGIDQLRGSVEASLGA
jgi:hypothetical protein